MPRRYVAPHPVDLLVPLVLALLAALIGYALGAQALCDAQCGGSGEGVVSAGPLACTCGVGP